MWKLTDIETLLALTYATSRASHSFPIPITYLSENYDLYGREVLGLFYPYRQVVEKLRNRIRRLRKLLPHVEKIEKIRVGAELGIELDLHRLVEEYVTYRNENVRMRLIQSLILLSLLEPVPLDLVPNIVKDVSERDDESIYMLSVTVGRYVPHCLISLTAPKVADAVLRVDVWACFGDLCVELVEL
ncbi:MAG: hypothetical protein GXO26_02845 [Crenarchaeota archaeon]|nr:hypothetical protein [Thermoproteota archaeon]